MNRGNSRESGYTIIETLIFLAVSGAMATSVMLLIGGQQSRTEFQTSVREFQVQLQDMANDVSTGYYNSPPAGSFGRCRSNPPGVQFDNGNGDVRECILVGRTLQFNNTASNYKVLTMVGKKINTSGVEVKNFTEAMPIALSSYTSGAGPNPDTTQTEGLRASTVEKIQFNNGGVPVDIGSFGFFTSFYQSNAIGLASGSSRVSVLPITTSSLTDSDSVAVTKMNVPANLAVVNPSGGVKICLKSSGTAQHAIISLGTEKAGSLTVTAEILEGASCPAGSLF